MPIPHTLHDVWIGLGSNIEPAKNLAAAAELLRQRWPDIRFSAVYQSPAFGFADQADFLNAVGHFSTRSSPEQIRDHLQWIEKTLKKNPPFRNGPRTIDLDLLLFGKMVLPDTDSWRTIASGEATNRLVIPHPRMHTRAFVITPLHEMGIAGKHPVLQLSWQEIAKNLATEPLKKTDIQLD